MDEIPQNPSTETPSPWVTPAELAHCTRLLETIAGDAMILSQLSHEDRVRFVVAAGRVIHPDRVQVRRRIKIMRRDKREKRESIDRGLRASTDIRAARLDSVFVPPPKRIEVGNEEPAGPAEELQRPRDCYICKAEFTKLHFFYDSMCATCARFNYEKRFQTASLAGRVAIITGARLKIGYQAALMMLRAGARVIVTTRFPQDAALRFTREADFKNWGPRLQVHGLDLRHSPSVEIFTRMMVERLDRLDILINNAAQTVRRPPGFYAHLMETEALAHDALPAEARAVLAGHEELKLRLTTAPDTQWLSEWHENKSVTALGLGAHQSLGITASAALSQVPYNCDDTAPASELFPQGQLDADLQQVDIRKMNSWRMTLADVPTAELLEVQLVNAVAPFILCSKLKPLMMRDRTDQKHIVNVSAMEGQFNRHTKTDKHPHTNMAKAALNMMTLTSARDYEKGGIYMNAVDTGWVTDEDPAALSARKQRDHDFQPPLDIVDGAARICDPFFSGLLTGKHSWGCFLKDYVPTKW